MCRLGSVSSRLRLITYVPSCATAVPLCLLDTPNRDQVKFDFSWDATDEGCPLRARVKSLVAWACCAPSHSSSLGWLQASCPVACYYWWEFIQHVGCVVATVSAGAAMALRRSRVDLCMLALTITCMPNFCLTWLCIRVLHRSPNNAWFVCLLIVSGLPIAGAMNSEDEFFADDYFEAMAGVACGALMHGVTRQFQPQTPAAVPSAASDAAPETHEIAWGAPCASSRSCSSWVVSVVLMACVAEGRAQQGEAPHNLRHHIVVLNSVSTWSGLMPCVARQTRPHRPAPCPRQRSRRSPRRRCLRYSRSCRLVLMVCVVERRMAVLIVFVIVWGAPCNCASSRSCPWLALQKAAQQGEAPRTHCRLKQCVVLVVAHALCYKANK